MRCWSKREFGVLLVSVNTQVFHISSCGRIFWKNYPQDGVLWIIMNNSWKKKARMIRNYGSSGLCFAVIIGVANLSVNFIRAPCICWIFTRFGGRSVDFSTRLGGRGAEFPPGMVGEAQNFHQVWWEGCGFFHQDWWRSTSFPFMLMRNGNISVKHPRWNIQRGCCLMFFLKATMSAENFCSHA